VSPDNAAAAAAAAAGLYRGAGSTPVPDPTLLTMAALNREITALREILEARIGGDREIIATRLAGMDEAIKLLQTILDRRAAETDVKVAHLQALHDQKFATVEERFKTVGVEFVSVQTQFSERDVRGRDAALANTTAVNAALQAQKEAAGEQAKSFTLSIDKSEKGTLEQIAQQRVLLETMKQTLDGKVEDVKERVTRVESVAVGVVTAKQDASTTHTASNQNVGMIVGLIGVALAIVVALERFIR
jgi:hypothetical protein